MPTRSRATSGARCASSARATASRRSGGSSDSRSAQGGEQRVAAGQDVGRGAQAGEVGHQRPERRLPAPRRARGPGRGQRHLATGGRRDDPEHRLAVVPPSTKARLPSIATGRAAAVRSAANGRRDPRSWARKAVARPRSGGRMPRTRPSGRGLQASATLRRRAPPSGHDRPAGRGAAGRSACPGGACVASANDGGWECAAAQAGPAGPVAASARRPRRSARPPRRDAARPGSGRVGAAQEREQTLVLGGRGDRAGPQVALPNGRRAQGRDQAAPPP